MSRDVAEEAGFGRPDRTCASPPRSRAQPNSGRATCIAALPVPECNPECEVCRRCRNLRRHACLLTALKVPAAGAGGLIRQGRRGRSGLAAATLMTRADLPRLTACARRFRSRSSVSRSSASVSMNNVTNMGCMVFPPFSRFTPRPPAGRGQSSAEKSPGHREGVRPGRRTRSLRCTAGSIPARGDRRRCGRHRGPGGQRGGTGVGVNTWRTSGLGATDVVGLEGLVLRGYVPDRPRSG